MKRYAIIVAGGQGLRFGAAIPKQFLSVNGRPILFYTLEKFHGIADEIILVLPESHQEYWKELCDKESFRIPVTIITGGDSRTQSVMNGLSAINGNGIVAIHDAVRPFVSKQLLNQLYQVATEKGNAVPVIAMPESIRFRDVNSNYSVNRTDYAIVQTPQCFNLQLIKKAYHNIGSGIFTDDASVLENSGEAVYLVEGETYNIKVTYREDILYAEALLKSSIL
ncbi:MAG: 2-C-methyl-D-erythritol 4-phosphate cytidylyltransferase [Bacteroidota bacterium]|nr:2-C-methyl-D-erythritol 4-phosphate cytidylyltransferase [Bacteroidota bacterium]